MMLLKYFVQFIVLLVLFNDGDAQSARIISMTTTSKPITKIPAAATLCEEECCTCNLKKTIIICSACQELSLIDMGRDKPTRIPTEAVQIEIKKVRRLKIAKAILSRAINLRLFKIDSIDSLEMESYALSFSARSEVSPSPLNVRTNHEKAGKFNMTGLLTVDIANSNIDQMMSNTLRGHIKEIRISNTTINTVMKAAITDLHYLDILTIQDSNITTFESNSLTNLITKKLVFKKNNVNAMKEHALNMSVENSVSIQQNDIGDIETEAFSLQSPNTVELENNNIGYVFRHAFDFSTRNPIRIQNNIFHHLQRHSFHYIKPLNLFSFDTQLVFRDNTIQTFDIGALYFNELYRVSALQIVNLKLLKDCGCNFLPFLEKLIQNNTILPRSGTERIPRQTNTTHFRDLVYSLGNSSKPETNVPVNNSKVDVKPITPSNARISPRNMDDDSNIIQKLYDATSCSLDEDFVTLDDYLRSSCLCTNTGGKNKECNPKAEGSKIFLELILPIVCIIVLLFIACIIMLCIRKPWKKHQTNRRFQELVRYNNYVSTKKPNPNQVKPDNELKGSPTNWIMAVPDTRTYKEVELQVQVEYTAPMEEGTLLQGQRRSRME